MQAYIINKDILLYKASRIKMQNFVRKNDEKILTILAFVSILLGLLIIGFLCYRLYAQGYGFLGKLDNEVSSQVGNFIGGIVGPLWVLASVFIFYLALRKQGKEITEQIREQKETKFENTFFNLIRTQQEITNNIRLKIEAMNETYEYEGRDFFLKAKRDLELICKYLSYDNYKDVFETITILESELAISRYRLTERDYKNAALNGSQLDIIKKAYNIFFDVNHIVIGHYFRHLYHILKFIDDAKTKEVERLTSPSTQQLKEIDEHFFKYASFIQAQMSSAELYLLFYNQLYFPKMGKLVEKYDLLENLAYEDLVIESHKELYKKGLKSRNEISN
jgi:hypothetical protein